MKNLKDPILTLKKISHLNAYVQVRYMISEELLKKDKIVIKKTAGLCQLLYPATHPTLSETGKII
ncbi:MAG TPA: hypothetical protein VHO70_22950 [Chitinispirillaceae bacterium]|nr:hypothetical protein [Chitinispirillaceae bacterium]